jgi:hypothetical protein
VAQFFTDFSEYTAGVAPNDWTARFSEPHGTVRNSGIPSGSGSHALELDSTNSISWDASGISSGDVEVVARINATSLLSTSSNRARIFMHGAGSSRTFYSVGISGNGWFLQRWTDGNSSTITSNSHAAVGTNKWLWLRLGRSGNTIRAKLWEHGQPEPSSWGFSVSDTAFTSGFVGIDRSSATGTLWVDVFGVGTNGDPAPVEPVAPGEAPDVPDNFSLTTIDHQGAQGNWDEPADADTYDVRWDTDDSFSDPTLITDIGDPPQNISGLPSDTTIYAQVRAVNEHGESDWSTSDSATTDPSPSPPDVPTNVDATEQDHQSIRITGDGDAETEAFDIRRSLAGQNDWTVIATGIAVLDHLDSGLAAVTSYDYQVRGCNEWGCSDWSATVTATTKQAPIFVTERLPSYVWTGEKWAEIGPKPPVTTYTEVIGDGSETSFAIIHGLSETAVLVQVWGQSGVLAMDAVDAIEVTNEDTVTVTFSSAPATDAYRVVIVALNT